MTKVRSVVVVLGGTKMPRGGLTSSALNRATQLAARGHDVGIYTFDYRPDFAAHVHHLKHQGLVGEDVRVENFYESLRLKRISSGEGNRVSDPKSVDLLVQSENKRLTRFFDPTGRFVFSELLGDGQSLWRRYYTDNRMEKRRVEYSVKGTLHRETVFVDNSAQISSISYLDELGRAYFTQWMDAAGPADVFVATEEGNNGYTRFSSLEAAQEEWFHSAVSGLEGPVTVMVDDCSMSPVVRDLHRADVKKIAIFHNDHNTKAHRPMIDAMGSWDAVVCSTQGQKRVLREVVPRSLSITSIAQPIPDRRVEKGQIRDRGTSRFGYFGRLTAVKNVLPLVKCFAEVVSSLPHASLDIYGSGPQEGQLRELVTQMNLQNHVRIMGRTDHSMERMLEYSAVILPSAYEAFGLVVGESMLMQTPVIAFDCDFGPREIITHGVDGLLVETGNFEELAKEIIRFSRDPITARNMGTAARDAVLDRFSNDRIISLWENLIEEIFSNQTADQGSYPAPTVSDIARESVP